MLESIKYELAVSKEVIEDRIGNEVSHLLFPWEEGSKVALNVAKELGYRSACWGVLRNRRSNFPGDDPYWIPRVSWKFLPLLPGDGRISLFQEIVRRAQTRIQAVFQ